jgi:hypothetical protein
MTATPKWIIGGLDERDGRRSAWTGVYSETLVPQDRANRGMGGFKGSVRLSNYVWLESWINGLIESDAKWAAEARRRGIKISRYDDPEQAWITHAVHGRVRLLDDGTTTKKEGDIALVQGG